MSKKSLSAPGRAGREFSSTETSLLLAGHYLDSLAGVDGILD